MKHAFHDLTPTSHPDLFAGADGRLVHRYIGQLQGRASYFFTLPDKTALKVHRNAPKVSLNLSPVDLLGKSRPVGLSPIQLITRDVSDISGYIQVGQFSAQVLTFLVSLFSDTEVSTTLEMISQQLKQLMVEVGASDYLALLRDMDRMRGNASTVVDLLNTIGSGLEGDPARWYSDELRQGDFQLHSDINTLLDPTEGYFHRTYYEQLIAGDGNWGQIIPDRPNDANGATFEYRLGLPTVMLLIATRLMKFTVPDFVSRGTFSVEIDNWWRRIQQLSDKMAYFVRKTPITPVEVQAARRQTNAGQELGSYSEWETHCFVPPPHSISPVGAIDITTGVGSINWDYTQFDEWYLGKGDLHGGNAGYWPPSVGPKWYSPPPNATGLPPLAQSIDDYYRMAAADATTIQRDVEDQIGVGAASIFAWTMFDFAYPGAGTP